PAAHHVVALVELGEQPRDLLGRVLKIGIDRHDLLAAALSESGHDRLLLAEVLRQMHDHDALVAGRMLADPLEGLIRRSAVDEQNLVRAAEPLKHRMQSFEQDHNRLLLVVHRHNDRDLRGLLRHRLHPVSRALLYTREPYRATKSERAAAIRVALSTKTSSD